MYPSHFRTQSGGHSGWPEPHPMYVSRSGASTGNSTTFPMRNEFRPIAPLCLGKLCGLLFTTSASKSPPQLTMPWLDTRDSHPWNPHLLFWKMNAPKFHGLWSNYSNKVTWNSRQLEAKLQEGSLSQTRYVLSTKIIQKGSKGFPEHNAESTLQPGVDTQP